ncbi:hypothetical protein TWF730_006105 [Orbilia blumenaviensis]|uniref:DUF7730 domain-containing protein n=1 Tax=Orbilia blumenaviensis TaxID=1796055 RepID=A0AAV9TYA6_9PEZI
MANTPTRATGFLDLPRELRDEIYKYVLVFEPLDTAIKPNDKNKPVWGQGFTSLGLPLRLKHRHLSLSLLRTCRQIYDETFPVFYGENTFGICVYVNLTMSHGGEVAHLRVRHYAPWEQMEYMYLLYCMDPEVLEAMYRPDENLQEESNAVHQILPHGHLIKNLRIHCVIDTVTLWGPSQWDARAVKPLADRIQACVPNAFREITVDPRDDSSPLAFELMGTQHLYEDTIRLVWPLTTDVAGGYSLKWTCALPSFVTPLRLEEQEELIERFRGSGGLQRKVAFVSVPPL